MRRLLVVAIFVLALALVAAASGASLFVITGRGWGHGVGLSQCGAQGFAAKAGWRFDRILAHYFPGTSLGPAPVSSVRVLLAESGGALTVGSDSPFSVESGDGARFQIGAGSLSIGPDLVVTVGGKQRRLVDPVRLEPGKSPLRLDRPYRGALVVHGDRSSVWAVNVVGLEEYLYGVVPREVEVDWAVEALKAQAVAARSYALASLRPGSTYDLYADTRSQVYGGLEAENERTSSAVDATAGEVVLADGKVAQTFFFASSGGRTASAADVWGADLSYLVAVDDPYDSVCPYHRWGPFVFSPRKLARGLGITGLRGLRDARVERDGSERVRTLTLTGAARSVALAGPAVRRTLELRSTWFDVGVLTLDPARGLLQRDAKPVLTGVVRGFRRVVLQRNGGSGWEKVAAVRPARDGTFTVEAPAGATALYRLAAPRVAGPAVRIRVRRS